MNEWMNEWKKQMNNWMKEGIIYWRNEWIIEWMNDWMSYIMYSWNKAKNEKKIKAGMPTVVIYLEHILESLHRVTSSRAHSA